MRRSAVLAAVASLTGAASQARAELTPVEPTPYPTEDKRPEILSHVYGGLFVGEEANYSNGSITAVRVDDRFDRLYEGGAITVRPVAEFSQSTQTLGLKYTVSGQTQSLFSVGQFGYLDNATPVTFDAGGQAFNFTLDTAALPDTPADPTLSRANQSVTYEINGAGGEGRTYLIFWEDSLADTDRDFNDLAVEAGFGGNGGLVAAGGGQAAVPLPPGVWLGLSTMAGFGLYARLKKWRLATA